MSSDRTVCGNSISNWVQNSFAVYIVPQYHPPYKYAAQLSADGVSNALWNVREVNTVLFCGKSDSMHFRALCVASISVAGSQLKVQKESFPWSSLQKDRTSPNRDTLPNLLSCSKKRPRLRTHSGLFCATHKPRQTKSHKVQSKVDVLNLVTEPRDAQSSFAHHNPQQILPTVIKTLR